MWCNCWKDLVLISCLIIEWRIRNFSMNYWLIYHVLHLAQVLKLARHHLKQIWYFWCMIYFMSWEWNLNSLALVFVKAESHAFFKIATTDQIIEYVIIKLFKLLWNPKSPQKDFCGISWWFFKVAKNCPDF